MINRVNKDEVFGEMLLQTFQNYNLKGIEKSRLYSHQQRPCEIGYKHVIMSVARKSNNLENFNNTLNQSFANNKQCQQDINNKWKLDLENKTKFYKNTNVIYIFTNAKNAKIYHGIEEQKFDLASRINNRLTKCKLEYTNDGVVVYNEYGGEMIDETLIQNLNINEKADIILKVIDTIHACYLQFFFIADFKVTNIGILFEDGKFDVKFFDYFLCQFNEILSINTIGANNSLYSAMSNNFALMHLITTLLLPKDINKEIVFQIIDIFEKLSITTDFGPQSGIHFIDSIKYDLLDIKKFVSNIPQISNKNIESSIKQKIGLDYIKYLFSVLMINNYCISFANCELLKNSFNDIITKIDNLTNGDYNENDIWNLYKEATKNVYEQFWENWKNHKSNKILIEESENHEYIEQMKSIEKRYEYEIAEDGSIDNEFPEKFLINAITEQDPTNEDSQEFDNQEEILEYLRDISLENEDSKEQIKKHIDIKNINQNVSCVNKIECNALDSDNIKYQQNELSKDNINEIKEHGIQ